MNSDGQLYNQKEVTPPPMVMPERERKQGFLSGIAQEELLLIGLILLLVSDKTQNDLPLVLALLYVLFSILIFND